VLADGFLSYSCCIQYDDVRWVVEVEMNFLVDVRWESTTGVGYGDDELVELWWVGLIIVNFNIGGYVVVWWNWWWCGGNFLVIFWFFCFGQWAVGCCRWSDARVVQLGPAHLSPSVLNFFVRLACGGVLAEHLNSMVVCCQTRT